MGKQRGTGDSSAATVIVGNAIAFAICLPMALPVRKPEGGDLAVLLYLGLFQVALAYYFLTRSLREVPGLEAATLLLVEPVFNPIWTWLIQGERPALTAVAGGALIIAAAFGSTAWRLKFTQISQLQDITSPD
jgi:DME family drug/metabolite transporter